MICPKCGKEIEDGNLICPFCNANLNPEQIFNYDASSATGEIELGLDSGKQNNTVRSFSDVINDGFNKLINSVKSVLKNKMGIIVAAVLAIVWMIIDIIKASGNNSFLIDALSFITFANAGMSGGIVGVIGGLIGKSIFAGAVASIVDSLSKKESSSIVSRFKSLVKIDTSNIFPLLFGIGIAFLLFLFISGGKTRFSFMGGIAAMYVFAKASSREGFVQNTFASIFAKKGEKIPAFVPQIVKGISLGFGLASVVGLIGINLIVFVLGVLSLVIGLIMTIIKSKENKKMEGSK